MLDMGPCACSAEVACGACRYGYSTLAGNKSKKCRKTLRSAEAMDSSRTQDANSRPMFQRQACLQIQSSWSPLASGPTGEGSRIPRNKVHPAIELHISEGNVLS